jgi:nucleotide-binding universal stress UspA family protein
MSTTDRKQEIVLGFDGSECAERALDWAMGEAKLRGACLRVVTAWHVPALISGAPGFVPVVALPVDEAAQDWANRVARGAAERARDQGIDAESIVPEGHAADALIDASEWASLLVVGSRGHGGFAGLLLGSVGQQCAHHAACPLVIVR